MNKEDALKQIESISEIVNSGNKVLLSASNLISIGILLCLVPLIDYLTKSFTFGYKMSSFKIIIINIVIYYIIFFTTCKITGKISGKESRISKNPLIKKAFKVKYAFTAFFIGGSFALGLSGNDILIYPMIYIFIGLIYNLIGQFSYSIVRFVSWTYIIGGMLFIYLTSVIDYNYLWIYFIVYMGITYIIMGFSIKINNKKSIL